MIAALMAYAALVGVALTLAARVVEWGMERSGWAVRWVWLVAAALTIAIPVWRLSGSRSGSAPDGRDAVNGSAVRLPAVLIPSIPESATGRTSAWDALLLAAWALASLALAAREASRRRQLQIARDGWERRRLDGTPVLVAPDVGPAVVGVRDGEVVVPPWVLTLERDARALVLRHELEHLRAGDAAVQDFVRLLVALVPWSPALWYIERRLRGAIEVDCDRRVLGTMRSSRRQYGALLLHVAGRAGSATHVVPALSESYSLLARRITAMTHPPRRSPIALAACLTIAGAALVAACNTETPQVTKAPADTTPRSAAQPAVAAPEGAYFEFQVENPVQSARGLAPHYPDSLRTAGVEGEVLVQFVVDTLGKAEPQTFKVLKASHEAFAAAVKEAMPGMNFIPASIKGVKVRQLVQQPFAFALAK